MSPQQAADELGIHRGTIMRWIASGDLPFSKAATSRKGYEIAEEDVKRVAIEKGIVLRSSVTDSAKEAVRAFVSEEVGFLREELRRQAEAHENTVRHSTDAFLSAIEKIKELSEIAITSARSTNEDSLKIVCGSFERVMGASGAQGAISQQEAQ